jgi:hypothetical protein
MSSNSSNSNDSPEIDLFEILSSRIRDSQIDIDFIEDTARERVIELFVLTQMQRQICNQRDEQKYFTPQNKELAEFEISTWCKVKNVTPMLVKLMAKLWNESLTGTFPTLDDLVEYFYSRACLCVRYYSQLEQKALIRHFLINFGRLSTCPETRACMEWYYLNNQTFPNAQEMEITVSRLIQMTISPEDFHSQDALHVPTLNLEHLKAEALGDRKDEYCALCQEEIMSSQNCFKLTPCGHIFHSESKECLGTCSIITWLNQHKQCPVCKQTVDIKKCDPVANLDK